MALRVGKTIASTTFLVHRIISAVADDGDD
jgi:hypothetical protein